MKISKEFIIGFVVTASFVILYWGFNYLKGKDIFSNELVYYSIYKDVSGLEKSNPVLVNGLEIGRVRNMSFASSGATDVIVEIVIKTKVDIPVNSVSRIYSSSILGSKAIEIKLGNSNELARPGDTLASQVEESIKDAVSRELQPLKLKAENLMNSIDTVMSMLENLFDKTNRGNIAKSVEHFANSFENLENTTGTLDTLMQGQKTRIERILKNIESISLTLESNQDNFNNILSNLSALSDTLAKARISESLLSASRAMDEFSEIAAGINRGEGSLGMLVKDDSLYIHLQKSARDLDLLLEDIRKNPKKYVKVSVF